MASYIYTDLSKSNRYRHLYVFQDGIFSVKLSEDLLEKNKVAFEVLGEVLNACSLEESLDKAVFLTISMTFITVLFDTERLICHQKSL